MTQRLVVIGALLSLGLVWARAPSFFTEAPWTAATFDRPHTLAVLLVSVALLLLVLGAGRAGPLLGAGFLLSLTFRGTLLAYLPLAALVAARDLWRAEPARVGGRGSTLAALALVAAVAVELGGARETRTRAPERLDAQVKYFADRGNVFRARASARQWCKLEHPPGVGCELFTKLRGAPDLHGAP